MPMMVVVARPPPPPVSLSASLLVAALEVEAIERVRDALGSGDEVESSMLLELRLVLEVEVESVALGRSDGVELLRDDGEEVLEGLGRDARVVRVLDGGSDLVADSVDDDGLGDGGGMAVSSSLSGGSEKVSRDKGSSSRSSSTGDEAIGTGVRPGLQCVG